ncbi:UNVERIFIED_ORG: hypothetical protein J2X79_001593 [Arthrobacter globiformis]|nr:hypothetical protein [Arthrobacter globiformis]
METVEEALERTAAVLSSSISRVFVDLEKIAGTVSAAATAVSGVPRRSEFLFLKQELANFIKLHSDMIVGAGIAYAPGSLREATHWLEWWRTQRTANHGSSPMTSTRTR